MTRHLYALSKKDGCANVKENEQENEYGPDSKASREA